LKLFPDFDAGKVASVEILRSNSVIRVERTNDQWRLTRPIIYPAQSTAIETGWACSIHSTGSFTFRLRTAGAPSGLAAFGLEEPQATVIIQEGKKKPQLRIGPKRRSQKALFAGGGFRRRFRDGIGSARSYAAIGDGLVRPDVPALVGLKFDRLQVRARALTGTREFKVERNPRTTCGVSPSHARRAWTTACSNSSFSSCRTRVWLSSSVTPRAATLSRTVYRRRKLCWP